MLGHDGRMVPIQEAHAPERGGAPSSKGARGHRLFEGTQSAVPTPTPTRGFSFLSFPPRPLNSTGMPCPLMGFIMRSAVNHSSISLDRLSLPETIYWIPRSKWAFFLFSSVFRELFRGSVCPFCPCWAAFVSFICS